MFDIKWIMSTPRKNIAKLWTLARRGFEPVSSGPHTDLLTAMPCHLSIINVQNNSCGFTFRGSDIIPTDFSESKSILTQIIAFITVY